MPRGLERYAVVLVVVLGMFVYFSITQASFFTLTNIENLLTGAAVVWIAAMGMTFVVLTGGIDLSVGSMVALTGFILAALLNGGVPDVFALILIVIIGAAIGGAINGFLIGVVGLSFFVVTLGTMSAFQGIVGVWSGSQSKSVDSDLIETIGIGSLAGVPVTIWIMAGVFLIAAYVLRYTYFGRDVYAVGGNIEAARLSGINTSRTLVAVYAISGAAVALASVVQVGRLSAASPLIGFEVLLFSATAVLLGGTSFAGGIGGVTGTAVGALFVGVLQNGLGIAGVSTFWQQVILGCILIVAVFVDRVREVGGWRHARMLLRTFVGRRSAATKAPHP